MVTDGLSPTRYQDISNHPADQCLSVSSVNPTHIYNGYRWSVTCQVPGHRQPPSWPMPASIKVVPYIRQHDGCTCPGTCPVPGHQQPSCWPMPVSIKSVPYIRQHVGCRWPGTHMVPGHQQPHADLHQAVSLQGVLQSHVLSPHFFQPVDCIRATMRRMDGAGHSACLLIYDSETDGWRCYGPTPYTLIKPLLMDEAGINQSHPVESISTPCLVSTLKGEWCPVDL